MESLQLTSPAFKPGGNIPSLYTCEGEDKNPELNIEGIPQAAKSLVLIMDDPDAPGKTFDQLRLHRSPPASALRRARYGH